MSQQIAPATESTLEDVRTQFETWRKTRKSRKPIPEGLWQAAVELSKSYPPSKICQILHLNYTKLKDRIQAARTHLPIIKDSTPAFIELDFGAPAMSSECLIEMKDQNGAEMKMHLKGQNDLDPIEICKTFWSKAV